MANTTQKRGFGRRINAWLAEPKGETFKDGKWRFWFVALVGLGMLNAVLTALLFGSNGWHGAIGTIMVSTGVLLGWLSVGNLHYSDSDARLARGVSALDSVTLVFVVAHFAFLVWVYGHIITLRGAEADYKAQAERYNTEARQVSTDNAKIAEAARQIAAEETKRARIENDTIYQARKASQAGAKIDTRRRGPQSIGASLAVSPVELEKPKPPAESSADFLGKWDAWIRLANFGELILAVITLIYIRNWTAKFNTWRDAEEFPHELDADVVQNDRTGRRFDRTRKSDSGRQSPISGDSAGRKEALNKLREYLKSIAFYHPGVWFKADLIRGGVTIRLFKKDHGHEIMVARTDQSDKLLAAVDRQDFRERLVDELIYQGFPLS